MADNRAAERRAVLAHIAKWAAIGLKGHRWHRPADEADPDEVAELKGTTSLTQSQQALYEQIHDEYSMHLYDPTSNAYRDAFINAALFEGLDLNGRDVAEIMCGNGQATQYIQRLFPQARCQGFDVSRSACADYNRLTGSPATVSDIVSDTLPAESFDVIVVVGGLHHVAHSLDPVLANIHQAMRTGGSFLMMEPNRDYLLEGIRRHWYRSDRFFDADAEVALSYPALRRKYQHLFEELRVRHLGGPGYFVILMSMVLRIPLRLKPYLAPVMMRLEQLWNRIPSRRAHAIFVAQWTKRAPS